MRKSAAAVTAHLSLDPVRDALTVMRFGCVWDGQPAAQHAVLEEDERFMFLLDQPDGEVIAFEVRSPHEVDVLSLDAEELWDGPRFDVPVLGLESVCVAEIVLAVQGRFRPDEPTNDVMHFRWAIHVQDEDVAEACMHWRLALEAGDMKAHYGLGYTLFDMGDHHGAYTHLRRYTELTPYNAWAWCWFGKAAAAVGERAEAIDAFQRAIALEDEDDAEETEAFELLEELIRS
jgi:tetratricopeptide (TPR) repeat protein